MRPPSRKPWAERVAADANPSSNAQLRRGNTLRKLTDFAAILGALAMLAPASIVSAEPAGPSADPERVEEMLVSASRVPRQRSHTPSFATVLDGDDVENGISTSVADALRFVPGLQLTREGARGGRAALSLRGLDPNHVVVLIDGVRLNDPTNSRGGSFDPTTLALVDIDRIEILRGPQSSIYGSDALAGVINIVSRRVRADDDPAASLRARGGRFHTGNVVAQASSGIASVAGLSIGASYDTFRDPNSDGGYDGLSVKAKLSAALPLGIEFDAFTRIHRSSARSFPESSGGPILAGLRQLEDRDVREILFGVVLARDIGSVGKIDLELSRSSRRENLESPGIDPAAPFDPFSDIPPSTAGDEYKRWDLSLTSKWDLPDLAMHSFEIGTRVIAGVDFVWEDGESDTYLDFGAGPPTRTAFFDERRTIGLVAEVEERIGRYVVASASLRYDITPDERDRFSPAAGLTIEIPETPLALFGRYSEGFKRPSFFALGNPLVGDPLLRVEESKGWEVGIRARSEGGSFSGQISYFAIEVKDIIDFDNTVFRLRNESRLVSRGVELEVSWRPNGWLEARGGVTFNPTDFKGTRLDPENRPRWRGQGEIVLKPVTQIEMSLRVLAVSSIKATSFHTGNRVFTLGSYERVDARVAWRPKDWLDVFVEVENLTDRTPREAVGFESPGIAPRLGVTIRK